MQLFPRKSAEPKPINWKFNLFIIWFGQIIALCANSFAMPFIPLYLREHFELFDEAELGTVVATFQFFGTLTFCISNPIWGALGDRYGRKLMLLRAYFLNGITIPLMMVAPTVGWMIFFRALAACFSGTVAASQALVVTTTPEEHHGFALGTLSTALWSGTILGYIGGGLVVHFFDYRTAFLTCGGLFIFSGLLMLLFARENFVPKKKKVAAEIPVEKKPGPHLSLHLILLLAFMGALALTRRMDVPFLPMLVALVGGTEKAALNTSFISALAAVGGLFSGMIFGALSDRFPAWKLALPSLLIAGIATLVQSRAESIWVLAVGRFFCFFAAGGIEPVILAILSRTVAPEHRGTALGWSASIRVGGGLVGAALSGLIITHFQTRGVFCTSGIIMLSLIPVCFGILHRYGKPTSVRKK